MRFWRALQRSWKAGGAPALPGRRGLLQTLAATGLMSVAGGSISAAAAGSAATNAAGRRRGARREPADEVDPNIGGIGHVLTSLTPDVQRPHGVAVVAPVADLDVTDIYLAQRILGFSVGASVVMAATGDAASMELPIRSEWDHDHETAAPHGSRYVLESFDITVESTVTAHGVLLRLTFPPGHRALVSVHAVELAQYAAMGSHEFTGEEHQAGVPGFWYLRSSHPLQHTSRLAHIPLPVSPGNPEDQMHRAVSKDGSDPADHAALLLDAGMLKAPLELHFGLSYQSVEQARRNLERELAGRSFIEVRSEAKGEWNSTLGHVRVSGGSDDQRRIFYTALYRAHQYMKNITEDGQYLGPFDRKLHAAEGADFYIEDNQWDVYRTRHPLMVLLDPERQRNVLHSYVRMYEESGHMPQFPFMRGDLLEMNGNHAASMFLDAYRKGIRDFDLAKAYEGLRKVATEETVLPNTRGPATSLDRFYYEHGFYPGLHPGETEMDAGVNPRMRRQSVAVTLDAAYDDWCLAELAGVLGKTEDAARFSRRAQNYRKLYDAERGFMLPRDSKGEFIRPVDAKWAGGQAGRDYYTECNGWVYTFDVQHDVAGLAELMGGRERLADRLDTLFATGYDGELKFRFLAQFPDSTALIGQYTQGNEPAIHIPYLYVVAGRPWKTQKLVRQLMETWYKAQPLGLPGDDDNGAMSSWYLFSAMGFYPVCPGRPEYAIGSPLFPAVEIDVAPGKVFRIVAHDVSAVNKYVQAAWLNGAAFHHAWLHHADVVRGGTLVLQMGPRPNREWGAAAKPAWNESSA